MTNIVALASSRLLFKTLGEPNRWKGRALYRMQHAIALSVTCITGICPLYPKPECLHHMCESARWPDRNVSINRGNSRFALKFNLSDRHRKYDATLLYLSGRYIEYPKARTLSVWIQSCVWTGFFDTVSTSWFNANQSHWSCRNRRCRNRFYYVSVVRKIHVLVRSISECTIF